MASRGECSFLEPPLRSVSICSWAHRSRSLCQLIGGVPPEAEVLILSSKRRAAPSTVATQAWRQQPTFSEARLDWRRLERERHGVATEFADRLGDAGLAGGQDLAHRIVVADDPDVSPNTHAFLAKRLQAGGGQHVRARHYGRRTVRQGALVVLVGVWALLRYAGWDADAVYWIQYSRRHPSHRGAYTRIRQMALIGAFAGLAAVVGLVRFCPRRSHLAVTQRHPLHAGCAQASRRPTSA